MKAHNGGRAPMNSERLRRLLAGGRAFAVLSLSTALFFIATGLALLARDSLADSPAATMKGFAASVSDALFSDMLSMEMAAFHGGKGTGALSGPQTAAFVVRLLTDINPGDPRSLVAGEVPGMKDDAVLLQRGIATDASVGPEDQRPLPGDSAEPPDGGTAGGTAADGSGADPADGQPPAGGNAGAQEPEGGGAEAAGGGAAQPDDGKAQPTTAGRNVVFIYHSHNRESWTPELKNKSGDPNSSTINITLVGKRLADQLEKRGVGALHSSTDYPTSVKGYRWELSYKYSQATVEQAMAANGDLTFFFDIHRDSQNRKLTTATIGGKDYAQVFFIIGHRNPNWEENEAFATDIHKAMEKKYPGISRGVWGKTAATGNGEYNQHFSPDSVLIEIGGVDNTLEECYRTADALAGVIADLYWKDAKADAAPAS